MTPPLRLISFGFLHLPTDADGRPIPPTADRIEDVRDRLRDPAAARDILDLDGFHLRVQRIVLDTPGAQDLLDNLADSAMLPAAGRWTTEVVHRDIDRPVLTSRRKATAAYLATAGER
jgi:hypothetical protein